MQHDTKHGRTAPRSWMSLFLKMGGWIAIVPGIMLLILTLVSSRLHNEAARFDAEGVIAQAEVLDQRTRVTTDSDGDRRTTYYLTLSFLASGMEVVEETSVSSSIYFSSPVGGRVTLRYLESEPTRFEVPPGSSRSGARWTQVMALILGIVALIALYVAGGWATKAVKTRRHGERRVAKVEGIERLSVSINNRKQGRLTWRERDGATGRSMMRDHFDLMGDYKAGDEIIVYRKGAQSWWEGDVGPRPALKPGVPEVP